MDRIGMFAASIGRRALRRRMHSARPSSTPPQPATSSGRHAQDGAVSFEYETLVYFGNLEDCGG